VTVRPFVLAYLPYANPEAEAMTRRAVESTVALGLGCDLWHAVDPWWDGSPQQLRELRLRAFGPHPTLEYVNGSLAGNWKLALDVAFGREDHVTHAAFLSNDRVWLAGAGRFLEELTGPERLPTDFFFVPSLDVFMLSRELWRELRPIFRAEAFPPSGFEDDEFKALLRSLGARMDSWSLLPWVGGSREGTIRTLGVDRYHGGKHRENFEANRRTFVDRWGWDPTRGPGRPTRELRP